MELPKINQDLEKSHHMRMNLKLEILKTIKKVEEENNYKFEPYEIDEALLDMIRKNQLSYIKYKFKTKEDE